MFSCRMVSCPFSLLSDRNMDQVLGITNLPLRIKANPVRDDVTLTSMLPNKY